MFGTVTMFRLKVFFKNKMYIGASYYAITTRCPSISADPHYSENLLSGTMFSMLPSSPCPVDAHHCLPRPLTIMRTAIAVPLLGPHRGPHSSMNASGDESKACSPSLRCHSEYPPSTLTPCFSSTNNLGSLASSADHGSGTRRRRGR